MLPIYPGKVLKYAFLSKICTYLFFGNSSTGVAVSFGTIRAPCATRYPQGLRVTIKKIYIYAFLCEIRAIMIDEFTHKISILLYGTQTRYF